MTTVSGTPTQITVQLAGIQGTPGSVWRNGAGAPSDSLGINGDYYLNDANGNVYQKALGVYSIVANIEGTPGAAGSVWRNGSGAPSNSLGINGDYYLDDVAGNVYYKAAGAYTIVTNLVGPAGTNGVGVPSGGATGQVLAKIDSTDFNTHWVNQSGGGGFIQNQRPITTGTSNTVLLSDGNIMVLWNSATSGAKTQTIPNSTGSLQVIMIVDFAGDADANPISVVTAGSAFVGDIATPKNTMTLMDSILGWVLQ